MPFRWKETDILIQCYHVLLFSAAGSIFVWAVTRYRAWNWAAVNAAVSNQPVKDECFCTWQKREFQRKRRSSSPSIEFPQICFHITPRSGERPGRFHLLEPMVTIHNRLSVSLRSPKVFVHWTFSRLHPPLAAAGSGPLRVINSGRQSRNQRKKHP